MPAPLDVLRDIFIPKSGEAPGLFQASATIITLSTIYLYFTGYVYCYFYYFGFFQVPLETLDATAQFYFIRAFTALNDAFGIALICLVVFIILGYLHRKIPTWATVIVMIGAFPALFYLSRAEALSNARWTVCRPPNFVRIHFKENVKESAVPSDAQATSTRAGAKPNASANPPAIELGAKTSAGGAADQGVPDINALLGLGPDVSDPRDLVALGEKNELFLLLQTKDRLLLVRAPECDGSNPPRLRKPARIYMLPRESVDLINLSLQ